MTAQMFHRIALGFTGGRSARGWTAKRKPTTRSRSKSR
jgi:hypothetical protein